MAVCGLSSMFSSSILIHPDMDSRTSHSFRRVPEKHIALWQKNSISTTMVDRNDGDELELSISSLNDAQRKSQSSASPQATRLRPAKEEFDYPSSGNTVRDDTLASHGGSHGRGDSNLDESSFSGPPSKRARNSFGLTLDNNLTGIPREQGSLPRQSSLLLRNEAPVPLHPLMPARSLPSAARSSKELRESSPSSSRERASGGSIPTTTSNTSTAPVMHWWLSKDSVKSAEGQQQGHQQQQQQQHFHSHPGVLPKFSAEGRGTMPATESPLQEKELSFKEPPYRQKETPSFIPDMLSNMETQQDRRADLEQARGSPSFVARQQQQDQQQQARLNSQSALPDAVTSEHAFHPARKGMNSQAARVGSAYTISNEDRSANTTPFFTKNTNRETGQGPGNSQESTVSAASLIYGTPQMNRQASYEAAKRRHPPASESQQQREHPQGAFARPHEQPAHPPSEGPSGGNANHAFYPGFFDAAGQPLQSTYSSQAAGFAGALNQVPGFHQLQPGGQSSSSTHRSIPSLVNLTPVHFGGDAANPGNQSQTDVLRGIYGSGLNSVPYASYIQHQQHQQQQQQQSERAARSRVPPGIAAHPPPPGSQEFVQSLKRLGPIASQAQERHRSEGGGGAATTGVWAGSNRTHDFALGVQQQQGPASHQNFSGELNLSSGQPRGGERGGGIHPVILQVPGSQAFSSSGLREFLSRGPSSSSATAEPGRAATIGPHGFPSGGELTTKLSLQPGPEAPQPLTVVLDGQSVGRRIGLQDYDGYDSFAAAMKAVLESHFSTPHDSRGRGESCTLENAIPGYVIAFEDDEGDVLLAGDISWREFVSVARQIRIVPRSKVSFKFPSGHS